jgi:hypothetical protein
VNGNLYSLEYQMRETLQQHAAAARPFRPPAPPPAWTTRRMQTILRVGPLVVAWSRPA